MIWILVSLSNAPVGSSANKISGLLTKALAIATLCIWPPDNWLGFFFSIPSRPTVFKASIALCFLSSLETPEIVKANSTLLKID